MITDDFGNLVEAPADPPPPGPATIRQELAAGSSRMSRIEGDMRSLRDDLADNTAATQAVASSTRELVELFEAFKGAFKVLEAFGKLARPLGALAAAGSAIYGLWALFRGHKP